MFFQRGVNLGETFRQKTFCAVAEGVGFEPTDACDVSGFQDRFIKPL